MPDRTHRRESFEIHKRGPQTNMRRVSYRDELRSCLHETVCMVQTELRETIATATPSASHHSLIGVFAESSQFTTESNADTGISVERNNTPNTKETLFTNQEIKLTKEFAKPSQAKRSDNDKDMTSWTSPSTVHVDDIKITKQNEKYLIQQTPISHGEQKGLDDINSILNKDQTTLHKANAEGPTTTLLSTGCSTHATDGIQEEKSNSHLTLALPIPTTYLSIASASLGRNIYKTEAEKNIPHMLIQRVRVRPKSSRPRSPSVSQDLALRSIPIIQAELAVSADDLEQATVQSELQDSQEGSDFQLFTSRSSSVLDSRVNAASKTVADSHAKEACVHHTCVLKARGSTALEVDNIHTNEECLSHQNPFIQCTVHPEGAEAIYRIHETADKTERLDRWLIATDEVKAILGVAVTLTEDSEQIITPSELRDSQDGSDFPSYTSGSPIVSLSQDSELMSHSTISVKCAAVAEEELDGSKIQALGLVAMQMMESPDIDMCYSGKECYKAIDRQSSRPVHAATPTVSSSTLSLSQSP